MVITVNLGKRPRTGKIAVEKKMPLKKIQGNKRQIVYVKRIFYKIYIILYSHSLQIFFCVLTE